MDSNKMLLPARVNLIPKQFGNEGAADDFSAALSVWDSQTKADEIAARKPGC
jgi:hypothetical protein